MRYALTSDGTRAEASPGTKAQCPQCDGQVIPKCGTVNAWHWAHSTLDCDTWAEPDTRWHIDWQSQFPESSREVTVGQHRADVKLSTHVIEFQHSTLSVDDIIKRENHYGPMVWVFDAVEAFKAGRLNLRVRKGYGIHDRTFRWKHPRKSVKACRSKVFFDLGGGVMMEKTFFPLDEPPYGGCGKIWTTNKFVNEMMGHDE